MRWEVTFVTECEKSFVTECEATFGAEWEVTFGEECEKAFGEECEATFVTEWEVTFVTEYLTRQYGILENGGTASRHAIDGVDPLVSVIRGWCPPSRN